MKVSELDIEYLPSSPREMLIQLKEISAISSIVVQYKTRAELGISIAKGKTRFSNWVDVNKRFVVTHGRARTVKMGMLPCKYIKIEFLRGDSDGMVDFKVMGAQVRRAKSQLSKDDYNLLLSEPYKLLYGD